MRDAQARQSGSFFRSLVGRFGRPKLTPIRYDHGAPRRVLFYCASNIGMGHLGRVVRVASCLKPLAPDASFLLATDAKDLGLLSQAGDLAVMKLPSFAFDDSGQFRDAPQGLRIDAPQLQALRQNALLSLVESYQPHVLYMDTLPHGKRDEMLPALRFLRRRLPRSKTVLCMRDIPCPPSERFKLRGPEANLRKNAGRYDCLLVAGDPKFFDLAAAYQWPEWLARRVRYIGFVIPETGVPSDPTWESSAMFRLANAADGSVKNVVASFGGGWQSGPLSMEILQAIRAIRRRSPVAIRLFIFTGPAIGDTAYASLLQEACGDSDTLVETFSPFFPWVLARADVAFLQAGSTPFQILESDIPILLYCRDYKDEEQAFRARLLAKHEGVELVDGETIEQGGLAQRVERALCAPRVARHTGYRFSGAREAAELLAGLLKDETPGT